MLIRNRFALAALTVGALILNSQSPIKSAILNPQSAMSGWRPLFDGKSLDAWRGYKTATVPEGWRVEHGILTKDGHAGDLITKEQFGDFELQLEWRISR